MDHATRPFRARISKLEATGVASRFVREWLQHDLVFAIALSIAAAVSYAPAWNGTQVWDDDVHITHPSLQSLGGLAQIWQRLGTTRQYYPLTFSVFWIAHKVWGDSPLGYHLTNIVLHSLSAFLLLKLLRRLNVDGARFAVTLFALHPVQVESVAWMSELKNTLSGVFYFGAALTYLHFYSESRRRWAPYVISLGLFVLALLSKTVIATFPAVLLVVLWWKEGRIGWKRDVFPLLPFFLSGIGLGLLSAWMERTVVGANGSEFDFSLLERCLIASRAFWFYLSKLAWPFNLSFNYPRWQINKFVWWQYLFPLAAIALLAGLWLWRKNRRGPLAAALFFCGTLFPAMGFLNVYPFRYSFVADHFQYLACIGPFTLVGAAVSGIMKRSGGATPSVHSRYVFTGLLVGFIALAGLFSLTWQQAAMYKDEATLWEATIQSNPGSWLAYSHLGYLLVKQLRVEDAIPYLKRAIEIYPDDDVAQNSLGIALMQTHQLNSAKIHFERAAEINPALSAPYSNLAMVQQQLGQLDEAISNYGKALGIQPDSFEAHYNLGAILGAKGKTDLAIVEFEKAIELKPSFSGAHFNLGVALAEKGRQPEAIAQFQEVLATEPDNLEALKNLARLLSTAESSQLRNGSKAVELAKRAAQLTDSRDPAVLRVLAGAFASTGDFEDAIKTAREALSVAQLESKPNIAEILEKEIASYRAHKFPG